MNSSEKQILDQKRDQFRVKIRNENLNLQFNQKRRMLIEQGERKNININDTIGVDRVSQIRAYISFQGEDFEQRVFQVLTSEDFEVILKGSDHSTLIILCNICAAQSTDNIKLIHQYQIPHILLAVSKTLNNDPSNRSLHTCIWGITNFLAYVQQDALLGDLNKLIANGVIEIVLKLHEQITDTSPQVLTTISEFFYNLMFSLNTQQIADQFQILSRQKQSQIFMEILKDLKFYKNQNDEGFTLQTIYFILDQQPDLFKLTNQQDIVNLLNILDSKSTYFVYHTLKVLALISSADDETHIQRLIFMTMIDDVQKHLQNENRQIRLTSYKILSNLSFSQNENIQENVGRIQLFRETVLGFHHCHDQETEIEMIYLLGNLIANCLDYIGKETVEDSGLCQILQDKLDASSLENPDYTLLILKLLVIHLQLRIGSYDFSLKAKVEYFLYQKNESIADMSEQLLSYLK